MAVHVKTRVKVPLRALESAINDYLANTEDCFLDGDIVTITNVGLGPFGKRTAQPTVTITYVRKG